MRISGIEYDQQDLMSKDELIAYLRENGESDRALASIRNQRYEKYGNELIWRYPISDGIHLGTFIVPVKEGFISLPFNVVDATDYELLELDDAAFFDEDAMQTFINDWRSFSYDLITAMIDMLRALRSE